MPHFHWAQWILFAVTPWFDRLTDGQDWHADVAEHVEDVVHDRHQAVGDGDAAVLDVLNVPLYRGQVFLQE